MDKIPHLSVVGHPNKGKSSLVATLTENDSVRISVESGTTVQADSFEFQVEGAVYLRLTDTPGFQRSRQVLAWLQSTPDADADRPARVRAFLAEPGHAERFPDEVALLAPIMAGSGILYVVDASQPVTAADEAEMTILQWTGQPRMAVMNPMGVAMLQSVWQPLLSGFFQQVLLFNPLTATPAQRLALLRSLGDLAPGWQKPVAALCERLVLRDHQRLEAMAHSLARYWIEQMARREPLTLLDQQGFNRAGDKLRQKLDDAETAFCRELLALWGHRQASLAREVEWELGDDKLMNTETWYLWGLKQKQLVLVSGAAGAATGLVVDLGVGGTSMMLGAVSGGVLGSLGGWWASQQLPGKRLGWLPLTRQKQFAGPVQHPNFPLVVMARALAFARQLQWRSHARREQLALQSSAAHWRQSEQVNLLQWAGAIRKDRWKPAQQDALSGWIVEKLSAADDNSGANNQD